MTELKIGYFDSRDEADNSDLTAYDEIYTRGFHAKNDGGGAHYRRWPINLALAPMGFAALPTDPAKKTCWGLIPDGSVINPLQAGALGDGIANDQLELQTCIEFIQWWGESANDVAYTTVGGTAITEKDRSRNAVTLVIPANRLFIVDRTDGGPGLQLKGPITIEGEDRTTSVIRLLENSVEASSNDEDDSPNAASGQDVSLFFSLVEEGITGITFRNFTLRGSYGVPVDPPVPGRYDAGYQLDHGSASLITINTFTNALFEDMVFTRNRAVMIDGKGATNLTMRGCIMAEGRRGGIVITEAENTVIENNDFRWIADDPVAITLGADSDVAQKYINQGGTTRVVGNRVFGCRGINVNGAKNVLIADNACVLCRGRAIHIGTSTFQSKGDTSTLNVVVRDNIITDLLDAKVDPQQEQDRGQHRAIDIEMLQTAANPVGTPGLPFSNGTIADPTRFYYNEGQGLQGRKVWAPNDAYDAGEQTWWNGRIYTTTLGGTTGSNPPVHTTGEISDGNGIPGDPGEGVKWQYVEPALVGPPPQKPTPYSGTVLVEGNVISRTRPPAVPEVPPGEVLSDPDHVVGFNEFKNYGVGPFGGFERVFLDDEGDPIDVTVSLKDITPEAGIAVSGSVRELVIRGNEVRNCDVAILLYGRKLPLPFSLLDVKIVGNDLFDWKTAGIRFVNYGAGQPQRVSILDNRADGDPYYWNKAGVIRLSDGRWADTTVAIGAGSETLDVGYGAFVDAIGLGMAVIAGNHVRNAPQLVAGVNDGLHVMQGNVGYCNPAVTGAADVGYHVDNVGIGRLIAPQRGWRYVIEDGKPSSPTFGALLNPCALALLPDAGGTLPATVAATGTANKWVKGAIVTNLRPSTLGTSPNLYEVWGWRRMTTGTTNGLGSDWRQLRTAV